jgi:hypothetical protein
MQSTSERRRLHPGLVVAAGIAVLMTSHVMNRQWGSDAEAHMAAIAEMAVRPWSPEEPFVGGHIASPYLNPWTLLWGLVSRAVGWSAPDVMVVSGLVNLFLILIGLWLFAKELGASDRTVTWTLGSVVVLWGISPWRWSGFINLNSLGFMLPYPSGTAFALMLFAWVLTMRLVRAPRVTMAFALAIIMAFLALSHPFTAFNAAVGILALVVSGVRSLRPIVVIGLAGGVALLLSLAWPYYSLVDMAGAGEAFDPLHATFYEPLAVLRLCLLVVALPLLVRRWRTSRRDPLVWLTILAAAVYLLGWVVGVDSLGRVIPLLVLGPQLAVAFALGQGLPSHSRLWRATALAALVVGLAACLPGLTRSIPAVALSDSAKESLKFVDSPRAVPFVDVVQPGATVLVQDGDLAAGWVARGVRVVAPPYAQPLIKDSQARQSAVQAFATAAESVQRATILRYGVTWVLWNEAQAVLPEDIAEEVRSADRSGNYVLINASAWFSASGTR